MGRPVKKDADYDKLTDPGHIFRDPDCWWVYLASGDWRLAFRRFEPYELPWFGWERNNNPRYWTRERLLKHVSRSTRTN